MNDVEARKVCASCNADLTHQDHLERREGEYTCSDRDQTATPGGKADAGKRYRCTFCRAEVEREECHKNRYGEYVCLSCQVRGKRWSLKARARHLARKLLRLVWP